MTSLIQSFLADEDGAGTVDWVVITAGLGTLGMLITQIVTGAVETQGTRASNALIAIEIPSDFESFRTLGGTGGTDAVDAIPLD